jgi:V8-like Glu-specific endopeptidase
MDSRAVETLAKGLSRGELPDAQPWDIGAAVQWLADAACRQPPDIGVTEVRAAGQILNKSRHYHETGMLARAWSECRGFDPTIAKHHAQALINLSALDEAEKLLQQALTQTTAAGAGAQAAAETLEYHGLLGRIEKQRFVLTGDKDRLVRASDLYRAQYEGNASKPYWHGINTVALRAREEREGVDRASLAAASTLAQAIYEDVTRRYQQNAGDPWLAATASEASLALGECDRAELWLYRFLHHPRVQAFDVESYDRQLREIWQGSPAGGGGCADRLAGIMSRHIARTQRQWSVTTSALPDIQRAIESNPDAFEKNFLGESYLSLDMVRRMLTACASIGCVVNTRGERLGTGFLVKGAALKEMFGAEPFFITNAHVISKGVPSAIPPEDALVTFEVESAASDKPVFYKVAEMVFTSPPAELGVRSATYDNLDVTVVRLAELTGGYSTLPAAAALPLINAKAKAYVVGHPRGSGLQISLHDSLLLDIDDEARLIHYRTPTDPGSSGSPVFNAQWEVIGVHHGGSRTAPRLHGSGTYEANEAIALSAVKHKLNA